MQHRILQQVLCLAAVVGGVGGIARAEVTLSALFTPGMVLQQKTPVRIFGKAAPGEKVTVRFQGQTVSVTADPRGEWEAMLKPLKPGGPFVLKVVGTNAIDIADVLVGEVWVCSGQSNMEWNLSWIPEAKDEIVRASDPQLRMFTVPHTIAITPQNDVSGGRWRPAIPQFAGSFSAVGYYFGKALRQSRKVPIGLIHSAWGGTRIEAWMDRATMEKLGAPASEFLPLDENSPANRAAREKYQSQLRRWEAAGKPEGRYEDPGIAPSAMGHEKPDFNDSNWSTIKLPSLWDAAGHPDLEAIDGGVWVRRTFDVPPGMVGKDLTLTLGAIDDTDITYINGVRVGSVGTEVPEYWQVPRVYKVPASVLRPGKNVIAVRIWDQTLGGGFTGKPEEMRLTAGAEAIPLHGEWKFEVEQVRPAPPGDPPSATNPNAATVLYNGMIHPLRNYTIAGATWYQGESNAGNPRLYAKQLPAMITNWRTVWNIPQFPFLIVQLAPFMAIQQEPVNSYWAALRESQWYASTVLPRVGTAIITDVGDEKDIHPRRKEPVGERLALLARRVAYGEPVPAVSPSYLASTAQGNKMIVAFQNVALGLQARPTDSSGKAVDEGKVVGFALAGSDGKFYRAEARVRDKSAVEVWAAQVPEPKYVRFGWADFPVVNLYDRSGLPVVPFRTDPPRE